MANSLILSAGTVFLWWTWWQTKADLDEAQETFGSIPLLDVDVDNETAFLVFAIVASVLTVSSLYVSTQVSTSLSFHFCVIPY